MALVIGIDEVGYGPLLGPLIISSVAMRFDNPECDLWKELSSVTKKDKGKGNIGRSRKLTVCDSKQLFSQQAGIRMLEATALPFILAQNKIAISSYSNIVQNHSLNSTGTSTYPWYMAKDIQLPIALDASSINQKATALKNALTNKQVELCNIKFVLLEPSQFNEGISSLGNKSDLLFKQTANLIKAILSNHTDSEVYFHIGKHGGKDFYLADIVREFEGAGVMAKCEGKSHSSYLLQKDGRKITLNFLLHAEEKHFLIALASIIGKYIRELSMKLFNQYWCGLIDGLRPTAGYGNDAKRFIAEVEPWLLKTPDNVHDFIRIR